MAKGYILVDEVPKSCSVCPFMRMYNGTMCTIFYKVVSHERNSEFKYEDCPIKELPDKEVVHCTDTAHHRYAKDGWNACIKEIISK